MAPPKGAFRGRLNPNWKGELGGYSAAHLWVRSVLGQPAVCQSCGKQGDCRFEWANISGQNLRIVEDWRRLCVPCHREFDKELRLHGKVRSDNKSGYKGVSWVAKSGKWLARIYLNKKPHDIGLFDTPQEADSARKNFK